MKIGFIGCGNMARPIILGLAKSVVDKPADILVTDLRKDSLEEFCREAGVRAATQNEIVSECDCIFLAVKPQNLPDLLGQIADDVNRRNVFILSIAAGKTTEYLSSFFASHIAVARIFPNLNAKVNAAVSAFCGNKNVTPEQMQFTRRCCESFGSAYEVSEDIIGIFGVLGGCAPAYTFYYIRALAKAAIAAGMDEKMAFDVAAKMTEGSAKLLSSSDESADSLIQKVCSPGGTTIEGIRSLEQNQVDQFLSQAFRASLNRDIELSK